MQVRSLGLGLGVASPNPNPNPNPNPDPDPNPNPNQSLFAAFTSIGNIYTALAQAIGAANKVLKWIERTPQLVPHPAPLVPARCEGDLKMVDVSFTYALRPERPVLTGLNLHVKPGEVVALCGPSGGEGF